MTTPGPERLDLDRLQTPIGEALILTDETGCLRALDWSDYEDRMALLLRRHYGSLQPRRGSAPADIKRGLQRYFDGDVGSLAAIEWRTAGTPFQRRVWMALATIPAGRTLSYAALATKLGCPKAVRAVGFANGANPVSVVVPCHRVIGSDGSLTGYGGGLPRKRWLLAHEGSGGRGR
ncbi:MAG: methylated-DNA--[protein]-cysteine S-methyltransferase [Alphaproteobacteria bacterium]|nr:methylated-DNA--[protein]-cysteine S-methyltransferase [Alphaproteobacteria bacterium]